MNQNSSNSESNVKNLCSRRLWEMLKNAEWHSHTERHAIESELSGRRHYLEELDQLKASETLH